MHVTRRLGFDLVERRFYSPIPDLRALPPSVWTRRSDLLGIRLDLERQLGFAESELARFIPEFNAPLEPGGADAGFYLRNRYYESVDAEVLYAMVRWSRPRRIVELGSGFSTLVIAAACDANREEGVAGEVKAFDPYPQDSVAGGVAGSAGPRAVPAQEVPLSEFTALEAGDVLFVDTSHAVKLGGDVNLVVLEVLPVLKPGVLVHFHDIWLPWEYHRDLVEGMEMYWTEQYLLQAFLAFNDTYEVLFATQAIARAHPRRLEALVPSYRSENYPSGFWIRRTAG